VEGVKMKLCAGIVGYGYWGPNLCRNLHDIKDIEVKYICELSSDRLLLAKKRYPEVMTVQDYKPIVVDDCVEAVVIATPVFTHFHLVREALEAGKHVLVTKPMAASVKEAEKLIEAAEKRGKILMVDHTFVYTGAVRKIKQIIEEKQLGEVYYFDSVRVNLGLFQHDINVIWDLAPHDISIMDYVIENRPISVSATGLSHFSNGLEDMAYVTVHFEDSIVAHFHVNWMAPVKVRRILIGGSARMLVYDDMEPSEKIKIYDKGVTIKNGDKDIIYDTLVQYRIGDMWAPKIDRTEALRSECEHFVDCIQNNKKPITDGQSGLRVVEILEAAEKSMKNDGIKVRL
jgi:predicted dehydrogenase